MKKSLKIYVYAICKNEAKFAGRWFKSMSEADGICVLDAGSDDGSAEALEALGAKVERREIKPWRFDRARNESLSLVPEDADICVCTDLDEVFSAGWRKRLEEAWRPGAGRATYRYIWNFLPDGREGTVFMADKIHSRHGWEWTHPVHEVLRQAQPGPFITVRIPEIRLCHYPDSSKSRAQYLPLLELAVEESPEDDRNMHYLGREYMYRGMWEKAIETLKRHLTLPTATWAEERCASMRYIARCHEAMEQSEEATLWLFRAIDECPDQREPWLEAAGLALRQEYYRLCLYLAKQALKLDKRSLSYISEPGCWAEVPYDLAAVASFYLGNYSDALYYGQKALEESPQDARLRSNMTFYKSKCGRDENKPPYE